MVCLGMRAPQRKSLISVGSSFLNTKFNHNSGDADRATERKFIDPTKIILE